MGSEKPTVCDVLDSIGDILWHLLFVPYIKQNGCHCFCVFLVMRMC